VHNETALLYGAMRDTAPSPSWHCGHSIAPTHLASARTAMGLTMNSSERAARITEHLNTFLVIDNELTE